MQQAYSLRQVDLCNNAVEIPIPPIAEQQRIVRILDKFEELVKGLPREIKLREKQYAYYRDLLLSFPQAQTA